MSGPVLDSWKPLQAEPSATPEGISQSPRSCILGLWWVCEHFCRRGKLLVSEQDWRNPGRPSGQALKGIFLCIISATLR